MKNQDFTVFHGGVHPTDGSDKALSNTKPIVEYTPKQVEISMAQTGPSICELLVKAGDHVERGQLIGKLFCREASRKRQRNGEGD